MKGAITHTAVLGDDGGDNITRITNAFDKIPDRLNSSEVQLQTLYNQQENAKTELNKPFEREQELTEKSARLAELDALLNMDDRPDGEQTNEAEFGQAEDRDIDVSVAAKSKTAESGSLAVSAKQKPSMLAALERGAEKSRAEFGGSNADKAVKREEAAI